MTPLTLALHNEATDATFALIEHGADIRHVTAEHRPVTCIYGVPTKVG